MSNIYHIIYVDGSSETFWVTEIMFSSTEPVCWHFNEYASEKNNEFYSMNFSLKFSKLPSRHDFKRPFISTLVEQCDKINDNLPNS